MKLPQKPIKDNKQMSLASRLKSVRCALQGVTYLLWNEPNARIHAVVTVAVVVLGLFRHLEAGQWLWLCAAIAGVWITEALNTAIELLCDLWCDRKHHPVIGIIKDVAAGAVLLASLAAVATGLFVFLT